MSVGNRIKEARINNKMTQEQLAEIIGVAKSTLSGYENDTREPNMITISKIMNTLSVDANYLYQDEMGEDYTSKLDYAQLQLIDKYRIISEKNPIGKEVVDFVINKEYERCQLTEARQVYEDVAEYNIIKLPHPRNVASAGPGAEFLSDVTEMIPVVANRLTIRADFVLTVSGRSMEPLFYDNDLVLVHRQPAVDVGFIGAYAVDDKGYIKKQGEDKLISVNEEYEDVEPNEYSAYYCLGEVIGKLEPEWVV